MKKITYLLFITLLLSSCKKECSAGYTGDNCNISFASMYEGSFNIEETCSASGFSGPYATVLTASANNPLQFSVSTTWEVSTANTFCDINGTNSLSFTAARQSIMSGFEVEIISGELSSDHNTITCVYRIYATGSSTISDECNATWSRI